MEIEDELKKLENAIDTHYRMGVVRDKLSPSRSKRWIIVMTAIIASIIPLTTLIYQMYETNLRLELEEKNQTHTMSIEWAKILLTSKKSMGERKEMLRYLMEKNLETWALKELVRLEKLEKLQYARDSARFEASKVQEELNRKEASRDSIRITNTFSPEELAYEEVQIDSLKVKLDKDKEIIAELEAELEAELQVLPAKENSDSTLSVTAVDSLSTPKRSEPVKPRRRSSSNYSSGSSKTLICIDNDCFFVFMPVDCERLMAANPGITSCDGQ